MENAEKISKKKSSRQNEKKSRKRKRSKRSLDPEDSMYGIPELPIDDVPVRYLTDSEFADLYQQIPENTQGSQKDLKPIKQGHATSVGHPDTLLPTGDLPASAAPNKCTVERPQDEKKSSVHKIFPEDKGLDKQAEKAPGERVLKVDEFVSLKTRMKHHKMSSSKPENTTRRGPVKVIRMDHSGPCLAAEQHASSARERQEDAPVPDLGVEGTPSYEDLMKALEAERAEKVKLQEALKGQESIVLNMKIRLAKKSSSLSQEKAMQIKLSSELQAALSHQQRAVEERDRLAVELQETKSICEKLQATVETEAAQREKLSEEQQTWEQQLREKTAELEESKKVQSELSASLQKEQERYEKLSVEHQALLVKLDEFSTKLLVSETIHENETQSTAEVPRTPEGQACEVEITFLGPTEQKLTCEHQNLLAELQSLAAKHEAILSEHRVVLSDYRRLQADHQALQSAQQQELKGNLYKSQCDNLKMDAQSDQSPLAVAEVQSIDGQHQNTSEEGMGLTAHLADLQAKNREACSAMDSLRDTVADLTKALDQQKAENVELRQALDQAQMAAGVVNKEQQDSDNVKQRQELQQEKDKIARLRKKLEKQERIMREHAIARRHSVELDQGVTEQSLQLIKELKSDNNKLQQRLLKELDRHGAYVEKSKAVFARTKKELEALWTKYKAGLKDASTTRKKVVELEAKLTAKEKEMKEMLSDTAGRKRSSNHATSNAGSNIKRRSSAVILNTMETF